MSNDVYNENHCWQYDIRLKNKESDLSLCGLTLDDVATLKCGDFTFHVVDKENKLEMSEVKSFIARHEWLGTMSLYPSHIFVARYKKNNKRLGKGILAGVVVMDMPAAFSNLLGKDTRTIERLISRGACVSWSPKNLASWLIMKSIDWMVSNTQYRVFTAYSDPEARELGTIYQACNFHYLGQTHGTTKKYRYIGTSKWFSDRSFRSRSAYKRYAKELGINWDKSWSTGDSVNFNLIPTEICSLLKDHMKKQYSICESRASAPKHKYCYIKGKNKTETKYLNRLFTQHNPNLVNMSYPKLRGE